MKISKVNGRIAKTVTAAVVAVAAICSAVFALLLFFGGNAAYVSQPSAYAATAAEPIEVTENNAILTGGVYGALSGRLDKPQITNSDFGRLTAFELIKDGVTVTAESGNNRKPFAEYEHYINEYLPAGWYTLNLIVTAGTSTKVFPYVFEVRKATMHTSVAAYAKDLFKEFEVKRKQKEGGYFNITELLANRDSSYSDKLGLNGNFKPDGERLEVETAEGAWEIPTEAGYWHDNAATYFTGRRLLFSDSIDSDATKSDIVSYANLKTYKHYFQVEESNYYPLFETKREFTVVPYDVVTVTNIKYEANEDGTGGVWLLNQNDWPMWVRNGVAILPTQMRAKSWGTDYGSVNYYISRTSLTATYDTCGNLYEVRLTFASPDHYRWNTTVYELDETDETSVIPEDTWTNRGQELLVCYQLIPAPNDWVQKPGTDVNNKYYPSFSELPVTNGVATVEYGTMNINNINSGVPIYGNVNDIVYSVTDEPYGEGTLPGNNSAEWKTLSEISEHMRTLSANEEKTLNLTVYAKGTENYGYAYYNLAFKVVPRENSWLIEPVLPDYRYASAVDGITACPLYTTDDKLSAALVVTVDGGTKEYRLSGSDSLWTSAEFASLLRTLPVKEGGHSVHYVLDLGGNYISKSGDIAFDVLPAANSWKEMPSITQWVYGDNTVIKIFAVPEVGGGTLKAKLLGDATAVDHELTVAEGDTYYENERLTAKLRKLSAGGRHTLLITYTLDNYTALTREVNIYVEKAHNYWETELAVEGWTWNDYPGELSIKAQPHLFDEANGKIKISFDGVAKEFSIDKATHEYSLSFLDAKLAALGASTHVLTVEYVEDAENSNYDGVQSGVGFNVWKASNSWDIAPLATSWQYGDVTENNFVFARSKYGDTVVYSVDMGDEPAIRYTSADLVGFVGRLKTLPVGTYRMTVSVDGTDDYYLLTYSLDFEVEQKIKGWEKPWTNAAGETVVAYVPSISDMEYGATQGVAEPPSEVIASVSYYKITPTGNTPLDEAPDQNGRYCAEVVVSLADTKNYAPYKYVFEYNILPKPNDWQQAPKSHNTLQLSKLDEMPSPTLQFGFAPEETDKYTYEYIYGVSKAGEAARAAAGTTRADAIAFMRENGAGTYIVTVTAKSGTGNGATVYAEFTVIAERNDNRWTAEKSTHTLVYGQNEDGALFTALSGGSVKYVYRGNTYDALSDFVCDNGTWLDVGTYTLTVKADERSVTWKELTATLQLTVERANNRWADPLAIEGWRYGEQANAPSASPAYGAASDVRYTYKAYVGGVWADVSEPIEAGKYMVFASLGATKNYNALTTPQGVEFEIGKAFGWISKAQVYGWEWNAFDVTVNLFEATANSDAELAGVRYTVHAAGGDITFVGTPSKADAELLNALPAGTYTVTAYAAATRNYTEATDATGSFKVEQAKNVWRKTPFIVSWSVYQYDIDVNSPVGVALYGDTAFEIVNAKGETVYAAVYRQSTDTLEHDTEHGYNLFDCPDGDYKLLASVAGTDNYKELYQEFPFIVFSGSPTRPKNYWEEIPQMHDWVAEFGTPSVPQGEPKRWSKITYEYFAAKLENNDYIADDAKKVAAYTVDVNGKVTDESGAIPSAPGYYVLRISSVYDGFELDSMEHDIVFRIDKPENTWTEAPSIQGWLACDAPNAPTEGATILDSRFEYSYRNDETGEITDKPPTAKGRYTMIVRAVARVNGEDSQYCDVIQAEIAFTVENGINAWKSLPTIESWSEEFAPEEPQGLAEHGTIVYTYYAADGTLLPEKPTTAGSYKLVATAKADGYDVLTNESEFTITPAWDESLLIVNIALALIACALAVVVIVFAVRRYREN